MAVKEILERKLDIPPDEEKQHKEDWEQFKQKMEKVSCIAKKTVRRLRAIADRNHEAWWDFKVKYALASSLCALGALITHYTESNVGTSLGTAGTTIALQALFVQNAQDLKDYEMAEKLLKETNDSLTALTKMIHDLSVEKEIIRILYIYQLAENHRLATPQVLMILLRSIFNTTETPWSRMLPILENLRPRIFAVPQRNFHTVFSTTFLVLDAMELGFNLRDLYRNKGSDLTRDLKEKAQEIEDGLIQ